MQGDVKKWVQIFHGARTGVQDGRSALLSTDEVKEHISQRIRENQRIAPE
jgi:hypothetical protein